MSIHLKTSLNLNFYMISYYIAKYGSYILIEQPVSAYFKQINKLFLSFLLSFTFFICDSSFIYYATTFYHHRHFQTVQSLSHYPR